MYDLLADHYGLGVESRVEAVRAAWTRAGLPLHTTGAEFSARVKQDRSLLRAFNRIGDDDELDDLEADEAARVLNTLLWASLRRSQIGYLRPYELDMSIKWLTYLAQTMPPTERLLDVGAGPGLLTAVMVAAGLADRAVAVEPHPAGAALAAPWGKRFVLGNRLTGVQARLTDLSPELLGGTFDTITVSRVLMNIHEIGWSKESVDNAVGLHEELATSTRSALLEEVAAHLRPLSNCLASDGRLLMVEKILTPTLLGALVAGIGRVGLRVDLQRSSAWSSNGQWHVALQAQRDADPTTVEELAAWLDALPAGRDCPEFVTADRARSTAGPVQLRVRIEYPDDVGGGVELIELHQSGTGAGWVWRATSLGFRETRDVSPALWADEVADVTAYAQTLEENGCQVTVDTNPS